VTSELITVDLGIRSLFHLDTIDVNFASKGHRSTKVQVTGRNEKQQQYARWMCTLLAASSEWD